MLKRLAVLSSLILLTACGGSGSPTSLSPQSDPSVATTTINPDGTATTTGTIPLGEWPTQDERTEFIVGPTTTAPRDTFNRDVTLLRIRCCFGAVTLFELIAEIRAYYEISHPRYVSPGDQFDIDVDINFDGALVTGGVIGGPIPDFDWPFWRRRVLIATRVEGQGYDPEDPLDDPPTLVLANDLRFGPTLGTDVGTDDTDNPLEPNRGCGDPWIGFGTIGSINGENPIGRGGPCSFTVPIFVPGLENGTEIPFLQLGAVAPETNLVFQSLAYSEPLTVEHIVPAIFGKLRPVFVDPDYRCLTVEFEIPVCTANEILSTGTCSVPSSTPEPGFDCPASSFFF